jgi:hypothetical protein
MYITGNVTREDVADCIDLIIEDNKFDRKEFLKECGIAPVVKKLTIEHLMMICKHKGYKLTVTMPEDKMALDYYLENQELETASEDIPDEFKRDEDEEEDLF